MTFTRRDGSISVLNRSDIPVSLYRRYFFKLKKVGDIDNIGNIYYF